MHYCGDIEGKTNCSIDDIDYFGYAGHWEDDEVVFDCIYCGCCKGMVEEQRIECPYDEHEFSAPDYYLVYRYEKRHLASILRRIEINKYTHLLKLCNGNERIMRHLLRSYYSFDWGRLDEWKKQCEEFGVHYLKFKYYAETIAFSREIYDCIKKTGRCVFNLYIQ